MFYHKFYSAAFVDKKCTVKRHLHEVIPMTIIAILLMKVMNHINLNEYLFSVTSDYIDPNVAKTSLGVTVTMEITNVGTQGYPGVGKTSVLHLAIGKEPAPTRTSTDCVDPPSRYLMTDSATEGVEWEKVTTNKMFELVCEAMKKTIEDNPPDIAESDNSTAAIASQSTSGKEHELPSQASSIPSLPQASNVPSLTESAPSPDVSSHSGFTVFPELLKELSTSDNSGVIFNSHWMMVTDCGGQPPFLDAAALFLRNSCLQIFPVKLNEPLSKRPEFSYFNEGVQFSFDEDFVPLTHKQMLETLAKSVASIQPPYTPSVTKYPKGAKFTIVGTFEDKAHECSETVEEKESILKEILQPYEPFQVQLCKKVILPINAAAIDTETKKERTESAKKLRRLFKKANVSMKVDVKLRWFGFLLSLLTIAEKEHKAVLTLDECYINLERLWAWMNQRPNEQSSFSTTLASSCILILQSSETLSSSTLNQCSTSSLD